MGNLFFAHINTGRFLFAGGMNVFESVCHSFTTMATGGFSIRNANIEFFSPYTQYVTPVFMFPARTGFVLHYYGLQLRFRKVWESEEFRSYFWITLLATIYITASLIITTDTKPDESFRIAVFQTVSIITSTSYITADYFLWQPFLWFLFFMLMFIGGCAGSTGGGIKIVRQLLLFKNSRLEMLRLIHPKGIIPLRLNGKAFPEPIIYNVLAFFIIYILIFVFASLFMSMLGLDFETSTGSVATSLGNVGLGLGKVGPVDNFSYIPSAGKWALALLMLLGRLELFTMLVLFSSAFRKR